MNIPIRDDLDQARNAGIGPIRRRHVLYVEGYDPRGASGFFELFRRTCERAQKLWPFTAAVQPVEIDSDDLAHWRVELRGANWQTATHYDFLRLEDHIRADMNRPTIPQVVRGLGWFAGDLLTGATFRIFYAAWRFALHLLYFQLLLLAWVAAGVIFGLLVERAATGWLGWPVPTAVTLSVIAAFAVILALRAVADRWRLIQINSCWTTLRRFGRGRATWLDPVIDAGARRLLDVLRADASDETVVVGHSTGGVIASAVVARALELDPELVRGANLTLLTLGSVMPAVALHPAAQRMRDIVRRLATSPALAWIDCQSRKDIMCFANFDPVAGIGVHVEDQHRNPLLWRISFKEMISPEDYNRFRWSYFRVHYQYIMAGDRPAPYDYILLVGGPMRTAEWPQHNRQFMAALIDKPASAGQQQQHDVLGTAS
jgi:pimeloyl-ACP methyl ester carboxylesterase